MTLHRYALIAGCLTVAVVCAIVVAVDPATIVRPRWDGRWTT